MCYYKTLPRKCVLARNDKSERAKVYLYYSILTENMGVVIKIRWCACLLLRFEASIFRVVKFSRSSRIKSHRMPFIYIKDRSWI